jgi:hypothetical protein
MLRNPGEKLRIKNLKYKQTVNVVEDRKIKFYKLSV